MGRRQKTLLNGKFHSFFAETFPLIISMAGGNVTMVRVELWHGLSMYSERERKSEREGGREGEVRSW